MRIYLADLGHNLLTYSSDVYPLGIANQATYLTAHLGPLEEELEIRLFREPQDLEVALDRAPPDLLGLSNYAWNEELSARFARYAKQRHPEVLTCMGGPNWPLTLEVQDRFLRALPEIDVYVDGPTYEGERAFLNLVDRFLRVGKRHEGVFEEPLAGNTWIDPRSGERVCGPPVQRIRDLDEIPSPYLAGWMDPFFSTGYFPLLQIARGCPFTCAFCNSGVKGNSRVFAHSIENVKADLSYIAERVKPEINLCFADDNFGMYARDEEIADFIGWLQDTRGWPRYIRTTTGKNKGERIVRVMRKTHGALPMTSAVQSMNPVVLRNIKRQNIKLETYAMLQEELRRQGMQSYGELILCLPGETRESFMQAMRDLLEAGASRISAHQLMLLHGAELSTPARRQEFGFETRFRVVARNIGEYAGEAVVEVEEMVVATPSFSFEDYLETRIFHLLLTIFFYEENYAELFELASLHGISPFDLVVLAQELLEEAPPEFRRVTQDFVRESQEELFPTRQACLEWAQAHYASLVDGSVCGNLLSKYSMLGRFFVAPAALSFLAGVVRTALGRRGVAFDPEELESVRSYLEAVQLHAPFAETMARELRWRARHDVGRWAEEGYAKPLAAYRSDPPRLLLARTEPATRRLLETKLETFGEHAAGLGKFTRTLFARDLRRTVVAVEEP